MQIGFDQINVPAPLFYRRIVNAMVLLILPSTVTFVQGLSIAVQTKTLIVLILVYITSLFKAIEFILGEDPQKSN